MKKKFHFSALALGSTMILAAVLLAPAAGQKASRAVQLKPRVYSAAELKRSQTAISTLKDTDVIENEGKRITVAELKANIQTMRRPASQKRLSRAHDGVKELQRLQAAEGSRRIARTATLRLDIAEKFRSWRERVPVWGQGQSGQPSTPPAEQGPRIDSIYPDTVYPGDPILITGAGFGPRWSVDVYIPGKGKPRLDITSWSETAIEATMPDVSGFPAPLSSSVIVNTSKYKTANRYVTLTPILDLVELPYSENRCHISHTSDQDEAGGHFDYYIDVYHSSNLSYVWGDDGTDSCSQPLKNGWSIDSVRFAPDALFYGWGGTITPQRLPKQGDTNIDFSIKWSTDVNGGIWWGIEIYVKGPRGVPYL
ncbi:MAG: IPT/TIG domain-containing protein [Candidatus Aminicenantales bacterium]